MKALLCEQCGNPLTERLARKACKSYTPRFCSRECHLAWRVASGWNKRWSEIANAAQHRYAEQHGEVPGYKQRREALIQSNQENPRRKNKRRNP